LAFYDIRNPISANKGPSAIDAIAYESRHRVGVVAELPGLLRRFGLEPGSVVAQAGLELSLLDDPENRISFHALGLLLDICASATGRPDFGLLLGAQGGTKSLGVIGQLMRNAPTLGQALFDICANQQRYISGAVTYLVVREETAFWGYGVYVPGTPAVGQICDGALGVAAKILRELVGHAPDLVLVARPPPRDGALYRELFGSAVEFDAEQHAVAFPAGWLSQPVRGADPALRREAKLLVEAYWARICPGFVDVSFALCVVASFAETPHSRTSPKAFCSRPERLIAGSTPRDALFVSWRTRRGRSSLSNCSRGRECLLRALHWLSTMRTRARSPARSSAQQVWLPANGAPGSGPISGMRLQRKRHATRSEAARARLRRT
jgi:hypothetical protein